MDFFTWTATFIWWILEAFIFIATLLILFWILVDLFRDHTLGGGWKAVWLVVLLLLPLLGSLLYLIIRGKSISARASAQRAVVPEQDWRPAASRTPVDDIAKAKALLDAGTINQGEYDALKSKALGRQYFG
ncbi:PLDc N-terminal domain-containing protein [Protaetiibacter larvae]|uniref:SHOCT domain-containing protein n=1 Tax=Protaetiibacter larvae TaxID=2592654 RepID=A0A5C1Y7M1_9MICO|nr:PLDc N-terminal domain-containing protein [Protaetiibacter larvae]QEO09398.1 SHOCT domain-containing protein [Protaetiibacter larvae]